MTFTAVLLFCTAGIAACAAFVFLVETVVAFCMHDEEEVTTAAPRLVAIDRYTRKRAEDKAA